MTLSTFLLVLFGEFLLEALQPASFPALSSCLSLQVVQKCIFLTELVPVDSWLTNTVGFFLGLWTFSQECLQSYLCDLYVVSVFCSYLYSDKEAAERLSKTVDEACLLLAEYNGRLAAELEDRRQLARMLVEYTQNQKEVLSEKEKKLEEYKQKLARVTQVRKELKSHIQSLPDLSLLPNVTGGLAPLPSAGDLFSTD